MDKPYIVDTNKLQKDLREVLLVAMPYPRLPLLSLYDLVIYVG